MIKLKIPFSLKSLNKTRSIQLLQRTGGLQTSISVFVIMKHRPLCTARDILLRLVIIEGGGLYAVKNCISLIFIANFPLNFKTTIL